MIYFSAWTNKTRRRSTVSTEIKVDNKLEKLKAKKLGPKVLHYNRPEILRFHLLSEMIGPQFKHFFYNICEIRTAYKKNTALVNFS